MLYPRSPLFERLHGEITAMPVIDCHEHLRGPAGRPPYKEPIAALINGYVLSDLQSAAQGVPATDIARLSDPDVATDVKWPLFKRLWRATEHTAYARVTKLVLRDVYGEAELTREALERVAARLAAQDEAAYFRTLDEAGIRMMVADSLAGWFGDNSLRNWLDGKHQFPSKWRPMIPLPDLHPTTFSMGNVDWLASLVDCSITSLDDYARAMATLCERCKARGAVGIKDQSAYMRTLSYDLAPKADAERQFNQVLADPRNTLGWPESKPLNDYLFHEGMRIAQALDLPVQLHTGHMAGIRNRVDKTNAAYLAPVFELHREVRFDLFHGNWPYLGDLLFLGKNYPNVALDCCWLHIIDPEYASELLERSVFTMPHTKVHGFGGDYGDVPEYVAAHLRIARENIAGTLARLVERGWLTEEQALSLAADWLFNNPNRFFGLGFDEIHLP